MKLDKLFRQEEDSLIRFRGVVYLLTSVKEQLVRELHKEITIRHLRIKKTKEAVVACYYFLFIRKTIEHVIKNCDICQKSKAS